MNQKDILRAKASREISTAEAVKFARLSLDFKGKHDEEFDEMWADMTPEKLTAYREMIICALESMQELERYRKTPLCGNCETRRTGMV